jgi:hypothetical protein
VLVRLLLADVLDDALAARAERVAHVEHVDDDVAAVDDLVQLAPDAPALALAVDGL